MLLLLYLLIRTQKISPTLLKQMVLLIIFFLVLLSSANFADNKCPDSDWIDLTGLDLGEFSYTFFNNTL